MLSPLRKNLVKMKKNKIIKLPVLIMSALTLMCVIIQIISVCSESFSDAFSKSVGAFFRTVLAYITGWIPFSFAELIIILVLPAVVLSVIFIVRNSKNKRGLLSFTLAILTVPMYIYCTFVLTFATAYHGSTISDKLGLERSQLSKEDLIYVTDILAPKVKEYSEKAEFAENGFSVMPYSFDELNDKLNEAYKKATEKYDFISNFKSNVKSILLSEPMTYTHISGVYTFFTGEANINVNYPDYVLPFTMAHEMAHQRGIAREDEANFVAFLVCLESNDDYILYSAYLNMIEYYFSPLYSVDKDSYLSMREALGTYANGELSAYSDFFDKYRDTPVADISNKVNNTYLQMQGQTQGRRSYGLVVELTYSYYKNPEDK